MSTEISDVWRAMDRVVGSQISTEQLVREVVHCMARTVERIDALSGRVLANEGLTQQIMVMEGLYIVPARPRHLRLVESSPADGALESAPKRARKRKPKLRLIVTPQPTPAT